MVKNTVKTEYFNPELHVWESESKTNYLKKEWTKPPQNVMIV